MHVAFPFRLDPSGRTATAHERDHVRQLVEALLFTTPGERVNRPDFGIGLMQLAFAPNHPEELASATQLLVQGALHQWLGERIHIDAVDVKTEQSTLRVVVRYVIRQTQERHEATFERSVG